MPGLKDYGETFRLSPFNEPKSLSTEILADSISLTLGATNIKQDDTSPARVLTPAGKTAQLVNYFTWANRPLPSEYLGPLFITDIGGGSEWISNGINLYPLGGRVTLYDLLTPLTTTAGTAKILAQNIIRAKMLKDRDIIRITYTATKSGTVETATHNFRLGITGTTSDTSLASTGAPGGTNVAVGNVIEFQRVSPTTLLRLGSAVTGGYNGPSTTAIAGAITVPDMDANDLFLSLSSLSSANVETYTLHAYRVELFSTGGI